MMYTGTDEERGLTRWIPVSNDDDGDDDAKMVAMTTYDLPLITPLIERSRWTKYIPVCSTFSGFGYMPCDGEK